jgi:hypothetical protein
VNLSRAEQLATGRGAKGLKATKTNVSTCSLLIIRSTVLAAFFRYFSATFFGRGGNLRADPRVTNSMDKFMNCECIVL